MFFCFQAEDGIRDLVRSRGLGDVYKRQALHGRGDGQPDRFLRARLRNQERAVEPGPDLVLELSLIHI